MNFLCDCNYILLPVSKYASQKKLKFYLDTVLVLDLDIALDGLEPDFYAYYDVRRFKGRMLSMECLPHMDFEIKKADEMPDNPYCERYRPKVHFSAPMGWLNDPNGLVYHNGKYHMFYQLNPVGVTWNNMHWGHAVSDDLVRWEHLPVALFPDCHGTIFSGSAIIDEKNLLNLQTGEQKTIVLFYTAAGGTSALSEGGKFAQHIAFSTDGGMTFQKYEKNPIIAHIEGVNRDPKVVYHKQTDQYIMALYLAANRFALFSSSNLTNWVKLQEISLPGDAECPDFYPVALDGDESNIKWVFTGASDKYIVGSFDGRIFRQETPVQSLHHGSRCYASQSWFNTPDNRRIRIAWDRNDIPAKTFNQAMTFPCEMSLRTTEYGVQLFTYPVREIEKLYTKTQSFPCFNLSKPFSTKVEGEAIDIEFKMIYKPNTITKIELHGRQIVFDTSRKCVDCNGVFAHLYNNGDIIKIRLISDVTGVELFINDGAVYVVSGNVADYNLNMLSISADSEDIAVRDLNLNYMR